MTTIKVNNQVITIANKSTESFDIDKESKALESLAVDISKSIEALNIVSNIKAMESFGYKSTEGVSENIKNGIKAVWEKIKKLFEGFINFFKNIFKVVNKRFNSFIYKKEVQHCLKNFKEKAVYEEYRNIINDDHKSVLIPSLYWDALKNFSKGDFSYLEDRLNDLTENFNRLKNFDYNQYVETSKIINYLHYNIDNIDSDKTKEYINTIKDFIDETNHMAKVYENVNYSSNLNFHDINKYKISVDVMEVFEAIGNINEKFIDLTLKIKYTIDDIEKFTDHLTQRISLDIKYMNTISLALINKIDNENELTTIREITLSLSKVINNNCLITKHGNEIMLYCNGIYETIMKYNKLREDVIRRLVS